MIKQTWRTAAILSATFAIVGATACSKNDAATNACTAAHNSESCSACCSGNGASGYKIVSGSACTCLGGSGAAAKPAATTPAAPNAKAATPGFAGTYQSNFGPTTFVQAGSAFNATYPKGTMTCRPTGNTLDCDWKEARLSGKAKLTKAGDGSLNGTWGTGASDTNGGEWHFTL